MRRQGQRTAETGQRGIGISDVTGPAAEVNMMGYANPSQRSNGIHLRQYSRAYIVQDKSTGTKVVFVNVDACMISTILKTQVLAELQSKYGGVYNASNVCLSGTHTHSGPGGFHQYLLFDITSLGFIKQTLDALVTGIVKSISKAHDNIQDGNIYINDGELLNSNINRSPTAYLNNPEEERKRYKYDVDKTMTVLKMVDSNDKPIGMISWFAVHCTSMNNTNKLISSDNKGYASQLFERYMNPGQLAGKGKFVAAFAQSNEGDVSPNTRGPHCQDTGKPCNTQTSTCNGKSQLCVASGPGKDMFESTKIIGENQYKKAKELFTSASKKITGPIRFIHQYVDMSNVKVKLNGKEVKTCKPAMGYSFAAGTTDGPGMFSFSQGTKTGNILWDTVRNLIKKPSKELTECQSPKPILLPTGEMTFPYQWQPTVVELQILTIGQVALVAVPGEFSSMSGRRLKDVVTKKLIAEGYPNDTVSIVAGLANAYSDYVATYEEYQVQRYEGASTIYGPHTLRAYIQLYGELASKVAKSESINPGAPPPNLLSKQWSFLPGIVFDSAPWGKSYGDVLQDASPKYVQGNSVIVSFVTGSPRNNLQLNTGFLEVHHQQADGSWEVVYTDSDWETKYKWVRTNSLLGRSRAEITWDIPVDQQTGVYRIVHYGHAKPVFKGVKSFKGVSSTFRVVNRSRRGYKKRKYGRKLIQ